MIVRVKMLAFTDVGQTIREVLIPEDVEPDWSKELTLEDLAPFLEAVFFWGQNEVIHLRCPSVSAGDVVVVEHHSFEPRYFLCIALGWRELSAADLAQYESISPAERCLSTFANPT